MKQTKRYAILALYGASLVNVALILWLFMGGSEPNALQVGVRHLWTDRELQRVYIKQVEQLPKGMLAHDIPKEMVQGYDQRVTVLIWREGAVHPDGQLAPERKSVIEPLPVSTSMGVSLTGDAFHIQKEQGEEQLVLADRPTAWSWKVRPESWGDQELVLTVSVLLNRPEGGRETRAYPVVVHRVAVQVSPGYAARRFVENNWQWMLTSLGAVFAFYWIYWRRQQGKTSPTPQPEEQAEPKEQPPVKGKSAGRE